MTAMAEPENTEPDLCVPNPIATPVPMPRLAPVTTATFGFMLPVRPPPHEGGTELVWFGDWRTRSKSRKRRRSEQDHGRSFAYNSRLLGWSFSSRLALPPPQQCVLSTDDLHAQVISNRG